jgi:hypothetical protein
MKRLALASAAVLFLSPCSWAQTPPDQEAPQVDPDKDDKTPKVDCFPIMQKADQAMAKVKNLSFKVRSYGVGGVAFRNPEVNASVRMVRTADAGPGESKEDAYKRRRQLRKEPFEWAFDIQGTTAHARPGRAVAHGLLVRRGQGPFHPREGQADRRIGLG